MIKRIAFTFLTAFLFFFSSNCYAGRWYIECINYSCVASQGKVKIYWQAESMHGEGKYRGKLTGVEGLPISLSDFEKQERELSMVKEKILDKRKTKTTGISVPGATGLEVKSGNDESIVFSKKKSMSKSKIQGQEFTIDRTLAFVKFIGDTYLRYYASGIKRYLGACEEILNAYYKGTLKLLVQTFILSQNVDVIRNYSLEDFYDHVRSGKPVSDLEKMIAYSRCTALDVLSSEKRNNPFKEGVERIVFNLILYETIVPNEINRFVDYAKDVEKMKKYSIYELYKEWEKEKKTEIPVLAFAKYLADVKQNFKNITSPIERYFVSLQTIDKLPYYAYKQEPIYKEFLTAIQNKAPEVMKKETFLGEHKKMFLGSVAVVLIVAVVIFVFIRKRAKEV